MVRGPAPAVARARRLRARPQYARFSRGVDGRDAGGGLRPHRHGEGRVRQRRSIFKHALRAAIVPIVTIFGLDFAVLLAGTIFTEYIFGIDGIGQWAIDALIADRLPGHLRYRPGRRGVRRHRQPDRRHRLQRHRPESEACMTEALDGQPLDDRQPRRRPTTSRSSSSRTSRSSSPPHDGLVQAVTDLSLHGAAGRDARHRRRVRLGQERLVDGRPRPARRASAAG